MHIDECFLAPAIVDGPWRSASDPARGLGSASGFDAPGHRSLQATAEVVGPVANCTLAPALWYSETMRGRRFVVGIASLVGSFAVYVAHLACGGIVSPAVRGAPAQSIAGAASATGIASVTGTAPVASAFGDCGCAYPRTRAFFSAGGDEKLALDPVDAQTTIDVRHGRGPGGKRTVSVVVVVRAYRTDVPTERPTTLSLRVTVVDPAGRAPADRDLPIVVGAKEVEGHLSTWSSPAAVAPRVYATITKSDLVLSLGDSAIELRGQLTLEDVSARRRVVLEKLSVSKTGARLLPERTGAFRAP